MRAVLWGKDHVTPGHIEVQSPAPGVAAALTRGLHPKAWRYTDPNEDAVALVVGRRATLAVVADGHNGWASTEASMGAVLQHLGGDPPPADLTDDEISDVFWAAHKAILDATQPHDAEHPDSRTTLVLALVTGDRMQWASVGDSTVYAASPASDGRLNRRQNRFLGYAGMPRRGLSMLLEQGVERLGDHEWAVLATDGFSDFARPFPTPLFAAEADAAFVAREMVEAAFDGGAGDNVGVAVIAPHTPARVQGNDDRG